MRNFSPNYTELTLPDREDIGVLAGRMRLPLRLHRLTGVICGHRDLPSPEATRASACRAPTPYCVLSMTFEQKVSQWESWTKTRQEESRMFYTEQRRTALEAFSKFRRNYAGTIAEPGYPLQSKTKLVL